MPLLTFGTSNFIRNKGVRSCLRTKNIFTGRSFSSVKNHNRILAFGRGDHGQLGLGPNKIESSGEWVNLGSEGVKKLWTGPNHTFAEDEKGKLWRWGKGESGQLLSEGEDIYSPLLVEDKLFRGKQVQFLSCGSYHTLCSIEGEVYGWGSNYYGELGLEGVQKVTKPTKIPFLSGKTVTAMSCGEDFSVVATTEGIYTFGRNDVSQLGHLESKEYEAKQKMEHPKENFRLQHIADVQKLSSGWGHTLALSSDGTLNSWGANLHSQCGIGKKSTFQNSIVIPNIPVKVVDAQCGSCYSMASTEDGGVWIWGSNGDGKMLSAESDLLVPTRVPFFDEIKGNEVSISSGIDHLAVLKNGQVWVWGFGQHGVFGQKNRKTISEPTKWDNLPKEVFSVHCSMDTTFVIAKE